MAEIRMDFFFVNEQLLITNKKKKMKLCGKISKLFFAISFLFINKIL